MRKSILLIIVMLFAITIYGEIQGKKVRLEGITKEGQDISFPIEGTCEKYLKGVRVCIDGQNILLYMLQDYSLFVFVNDEWQLFISKDLLKKEIDQIASTNPLLGSNSMCKDEIYKKYEKGKILVLKVGGIPTMVEKLPGNLGSKTFCEIKINEKGDWKVKSILGERSDSTNVLEKGEILIITSFQVDEKNIEIITRTEHALPYDASGRITLLGSHHSKGTGVHANLFEISLGKGWRCEDALKILGNYFDVYNSKDEMIKPKELKIGMTIEEIEAVLGKPQKKADLGDKLLYLFEDTVVTFVNGTVSNIEFR